MAALGTIDFPFSAFAGMVRENDTDNRGMAMTSKRVFRVTFTSQGKIYEIYARQVSQGDLYGFVEIEGILFGEKTTLVLDPSEEQLKHEFNGVRKTHIPFHSVVRIDEVEKEGTGKVLHLTGQGGGASVQPPLPPGKGPDKG